MDLQKLKTKKIMEASITTKNFFQQENVKHKFEEILGKKTNAFITSVLQCVASNDMLSKADPTSIYHAAMVAAVINLPLNNALGFSYVMPFNSKQKDGSFKTMAQFIIGYKGFIQLAQRSGQFQTISATPIYEGQLIESNPLTGFKFDFEKKDSNVVMGYAGYFRLLNGFEKTLYMTVAELKQHGKSFSQTFKKGFGLWETNFEAMAIKTVIKLLLSKFAPLSIDMQRAVITDQAIINDAEATDVTYVDNEETQINKELERMQLMINDATTKAELDKLSPNVPEELLDLFNQKMTEIK